MSTIAPGLDPGDRRSTYCQTGPGWRGAEPRSVPTTRPALERLSSALPPARVIGGERVTARSLLSFTGWSGGFRLSPDGRNIALARGDPQGGNLYLIPLKAEMHALSPPRGITSTLPGGWGTWAELGENGRGQRLESELLEHVDDREGRWRHER